MGSTLSVSVFTFTAGNASSTTCPAPLDHLHCRIAEHRLGKCLNAPTRGPCRLAATGVCNKSGTFLFSTKLSKKLTASVFRTEVRTYSPKTFMPTQHTVEY